MCTHTYVRVQYSSLHFSLTILDPPTRHWPYKPFLPLTVGKSHNTKTTFTTILPPPAPPAINHRTNQVVTSTIPSAVDGDSPQCDMYNEYVTRHNL
jgi:hypothetical protein